MSVWRRFLCSQKTEVRDHHPTQLLLLFSVLIFSAVCVFSFQFDVFQAFTPLRTQLHPLKCSNEPDCVSSCPPQGLSAPLIRSLAQLDVASRKLARSETVAGTGAQMFFAPSGLDFAKHTRNLRQIESIDLSRVRGGAGSLEKYVRGIWCHMRRVWSL